MFTTLFAAVIAAVTSVTITIPAPAPVPVPVRVQVETPAPAPAPAPVVPAPAPTPAPAVTPTPTPSFEPYNINEDGTTTPAHILTDAEIAALPASAFEGRVDVITTPPADVAAGDPWVDPDDVDLIRARYGDVGVRVLCSGDYTGSAEEQAVLGAEDSADVDAIFDVRDYYGIAYGATAC